MPWRHGGKWAFYIWTPWNMGFKTCLKMLRHVCGSFITALFNLFHVVSHQLTQQGVSTASWLLILSVICPALHENASIIFLISPSSKPRPVPSPHGMRVKTSSIQVPCPETKSSLPSAWPALPPIKKSSFINFNLQGQKSTIINPKTGLQLTGNWGQSGAAPCWQKNSMYSMLIFWEKQGLLRWMKCLFFVKAYSICYVVKNQNNWLRTRLCFCAKSGNMGKQLALLCQKPTNFAYQHLQSSQLTSYVKINSRLWIMSQLV